MSFFKVSDRCTGCNACVENCSAQALKCEEVNGVRVIYHNISKCAKCGLCWRTCPVGAIEFGGLLDGRWEEVASFDLILCVRCGAAICTEQQVDYLKDEVDFQGDPLCQTCRAFELSRRWMEWAQPKTMIKPAKEVAR